MKKIVFLFIILFAAIQFIPVDRVNPPVTHQIKWDSPQTFEIAKRACFDCHSNETRWPWYSYVAPASWLVSRDVTEGRKHLNFSDGNLKNAKEAAEEVIEEKMPMKIYHVLHPEAKFNENEKQAFISGLKNTFGFESETKRYRTGKD